MAEIWLGLQGRRLFHRNPLRIGRNMLSSRLSLYRNDFVRELVRDHLPATTFEDLSTPLSVTVTNLTRGGGRVFEHGPLLPSLLASTAIPGLFPPVEIDGEWYVDGGIATAISLEAAIERGADLILAIDLNSRGAGWRPRRLHDVLMRSIQVASARRYDAILSLQSRRACVVIWRPGLVAHGGASSFRDTGFLLAQAREMAGGLIDLATAPLGGFYPGTYEGAVAVAA